MTRVAHSALDEAQLQLSSVCENLLSSDAWQRSPSESFGGLKKRLKMIPEAGLPKMRVISNAKLAELGRIPRSNEGHQEDALEALEKDVLWGSEEWQTAKLQGEAIGDPDDAAHSKALALVQFAKWFERAAKRFSGLDKEAMPYGITQGKKLEVYWWIDWCCTNQDAPGPDMAALPAYAAACAGIVSAWNDEYKERAWCQVELLVAYALMRTGDKIWSVPPGFADGATCPMKVAREYVVVADPAKGQLTNEGDRTVIQSLTEVASRSKAFTCWQNWVTASTANPVNGLFMNVCCCCQCFGLLALGDARTVRPGESKVVKLTPKLSR